MPGTSLGEGNMAKPCLRKRVMVFTLVSWGSKGEEKGQQILPSEGGERKSTEFTEKKLQERRPSRKKSTGRKKKKGTNPEPKEKPEIEKNLNGYITLQRRGGGEWTGSRGIEK